MNDQNGQGPLICNRCNKPIYDGTIFKVRGQFFHNACLQCVVCRIQLNGSCFAKGADFYCNKDFTSLFGAKCCSCCGIITPTEGVRFVNGNVYHSACFTCVVCGGAVKTGDYFYIRQDLKLMCKADYNLHIAKVTGAASDSDSDDGDSGIPHRTCINDRQLRMLADTYQSDPKPSRQHIEKLSRKTGLRTRVVRIWFQNRRAKEKHLTNLEQEPQKTDANNKGFAYPQTLSGGCFNNILNPGRDYHHDNNTEVIQPPYQLYCPLDYLLPDSMPPNIELSSADLRNGEVISPKVKDTVNCQFSGLSYQEQCNQNSFNKYMV